MDRIHQFRGKTLGNVSFAKEGDSYEAVEIARLLAPTYRGRAFMIEVDRVDGMLIHLRGTDIEGIYFQHAACGYDGNSVRNTATIAELFGFGSWNELFTSLKQGGMTAYTRLTK
jgi:hypothetical protein